MNTKLFLLMGTSLSFIPTLTFAQCVATQDCTTLGYTETSCSGGKGIKCPFGNKWACFKSDSEIKKQLCTELGFTNTCTGTGYSGGASQPCNGKYNYCTCVDGYEWDNGACMFQAVPCTIGALYYSDGKCHNQKVASKTLLGVVIMEKTTTASGWIMTINPIQTGIPWDTGSYYETGITDKAASASCTNTQKLVALGNRFAAANAANNYKPSGTPSGKSWCLPSYDLLKNINNSTNFTKINAGITTGGGTILGKVYNNGSYYYENVWSSSEFSNNGTWSFYANTDGLFGMSNLYKNEYNDGFSVRPVLAF